MATKEGEKGDGNSFTITIADGFAFKSFLGFILKCGFQIVTLVLTPTKVYIKERSQSDDNIGLYMEFDIKKIHYEFQLQQKEYQINLDLDYIVKNILSTLRVKHSLEITKKATQELISASIISQANLDMGTPDNNFFTPVKRNTSTSNTMNELTVKDNEYNIFLSSTDLSTICKSYANKNQPVIISGYTEGVRFSVLSGDEDEDGASNRGKVAVRGFIDKEERIIRYTVPQKILKKLEKISSFNKQNSLVYIYFEKDKPIKFSMNLSYYGTIDLYLDDYSDPDEDEN